MRKPGRWRRRNGTKRDGNVPEDSGRKSQVDLTDEQKMLKDMFEEERRILKELSVITVEERSRLQKI